MGGGRGAAGCDQDRHRLHLLVTIRLKLSGTAGALLRQADLARRRCVRPSVWARVLGGAIAQGTPAAQELAASVGINVEFGRRVLGAPSAVRLICRLSSLNESSRTHPRDHWTARPRVPPSHAECSKALEPREGERVQLHAEHSRSVDGAAASYSRAAVVADSTAAHSETPSGCS